MTAVSGQICKPAGFGGVQAYSQATTWEATGPSPDPTVEPRFPPVTGASSWNSEPVQSGGVADPPSDQPIRSRRRGRAPDDVTDRAVPGLLDGHFRFPGRCICFGLVFSFPVLWARKTEPRFSRPGMNSVDWRKRLRDRWIQKGVNFEAHAFVVNSVVCLLFAFCFL